jgi:hypothetical protein
MTQPSAQSDPGPAGNSPLSAAFLKRIRAIHDVFGPIDGLSLEETIESFRKDPHPADEVRIWHRMAADFNLYTHAHPDLSTLQKREAYEVLLDLTTGSGNLRLEHLDQAARAELRDLLKQTTSIIQ